MKAIMMSVESDMAINMAVVTLQKDQPFVLRPIRGRIVTQSMEKGYLEIGVPVSIDFPETVITPSPTGMLKVAGDGAPMSYIDPDTTIKVGECVVMPFEG